jgi:hypothetical protein
MARKQTLAMSARVSKETDALRTELQDQLDIPLHTLIDLGFRALKSDLDEQPHDSGPNTQLHKPGCGNAHR